MFLGKTVVTFNDVAGVDEAKTELQKSSSLQVPGKFNSLARASARRPAGRASRHGQDADGPRVAGEAGVPFFSISAPSSSDVRRRRRQPVRDPFDHSAQLRASSSSTRSTRSVASGAGLGGSTTSASRH
jgi:ATP-dependent Zn protease